VLPIAAQTFSIPKTQVENKLKAVSTKFILGKNKHSEKKCNYIYVWNRMVVSIKEGLCFKSNIKSCDMCGLTNEQIDMFPPFDSSSHKQKTNHQVQEWKSIKLKLLEARIWKKNPTIKTLNLHDKRQIAKIQIFFRWKQILMGIKRKII